MVAPSLPPILLVDDSEDDLLLIKRLFERAGIKNPLVTFHNAPALFSFLTALVSDPDTGSIPSAVFTDLKMPGLDGFDVITWIREKPVFRDLPVVMLSGSGQDQDVKRAHALGVTKYLVKLPEPDELAKIVADVCK